mmetsp:Transcript_81477/g.263940  ORF Transcript_81477/g.263940 Transcript_81477/m.263940 type:complete len:319 (-) Transcript_81477:173-1129(-)
MPARRPRPRCLRQGTSRLHLIHAAPGASAAAEVRLPTLRSKLSDACLLGVQEGGQRKRCHRAVLRTKEHDDQQLLRHNLCQAAGCQHLLPLHIWLGDDHRVMCMDLVNLAIVQQKVGTKLQGVGPHHPAREPQVAVGRVPLREGRHQGTAMVEEGVAVVGVCRRRAPGGRCAVPRHGQHALLGCEEEGFFEREQPRTQFFARTPKTPLCAEVVQLAPLLTMHQHMVPAEASARHLVLCQWPRCQLPSRLLSICSPAPRRAAPVTSIGTALLRQGGRRATPVTSIVATPCSQRCNPARRLALVNRITAAVWRTRAGPAR